MVVKNGKVVEATISELWALWCVEEWDELMPFDEYKNSMEKCGVTINNSPEKCEPVHTDSEVKN